MDRNYDIIIFFQKTFILRKARIANFADIIKIGTMFIKTVLKDSRKSGRIRSFMYLYFLI